MTVPEEQLVLAKLLLAELSDFRFAIAGGVAVRLNGYVERPTEDLDLFTNQANVAIDHATDKAVEVLLAHGYGVEVDRDASNPEFGRIRATTPSGFALDTFLPALETASRYSDAEFSTYEISPECAEEYRALFAAWSAEVLDQLAGDKTDLPGHDVD